MGLLWSGLLTVKLHILPGVPTPLPSLIHCHSYVGWLIAKHDGATDGVSHSLVDPQHPDALNKFLFGPPQANRFLTFIFSSR